MLSKAEPKATKPLPQFLHLCPNAEGKPTVGVMVTQGDEVGLLMPLMWPTPKEREALPRATLTMPPAIQVNMSHDVVAEKAGIFEEVLKLEASTQETAGFASLEPDTSDRYLLRFYMHLVDRQWDGDAQMSGIPDAITKRAETLGIRCVARAITEHDARVLDGIFDRILAHCALNHRLRTLFVKLRGPGDGIEAGVRLSLEKKNG